MVKVARRAVAGATGQALAQAAVGQQSIRGGGEGGRVVHRHRQAALAVATDPRYAAARDVGVDDRAAGGHRLDLDKPECLGLRVGGEPERGRGVVIGHDAPARQVADEDHPFGHAESMCRRLQVRPLRPVTHDQQRARDVRQRFDRVLQSLVIDEAPTRQPDRPRILGPQRVGFLHVLLRRAEVRLEIEAHRHDGDSIAVTAEEAGTFRVRRARRHHALHPAVDPALERAEEHGKHALPHHVALVRHDQRHARPGQRHCDDHRRVRHLHVQHIGPRGADGADEGGAKFKLADPRERREPRDADRPIELRHGRLGLVLHAQHFDVEPKLDLGPRQRLQVRLDPAGGGRVVFPQVADAKHHSNRPLLSLTQRTSRAIPSAGLTRGPQPNVSAARRVSATKTRWSPGRGSA